MTEMEKMPPGMLEQFEAAFRARFGCGIAEVAASEHEESMALMGAAMWAWQASREALVIKRPEQCEYANTVGEYAKGHRQGIRSMVDAIEAQGLKVSR